MKKHFYTVTKGLILTFSTSHFLIEDSLVEPVQTSLIDRLDNRLSRWQHLVKVKQHFWKRWSGEYLHQLQIRGKWVTGEESVKKGTLVQNRFFTSTLSIICLYGTDRGMRVCSAPLCLLRKIL